MREIKFRAWWKEKKRMLLWGDSTESILEAIPLDAGDEWTEACEVMQYTGYNDDKGLDIYEGDITQDKDIIKWYWRPYHFSDGSREEIEIIGNIHENPELLTKGEKDAKHS